MFAILASGNRLKETTEGMLFFYEAMMRKGMDLIDKSYTSILNEPEKTQEFINTVSDSFKAFGLIILGIIVGAEWISDIVHKGENYSWFDTIGNALRLIFGKLVLDYSSTLLLGLDWEGRKMITSIMGRVGTDDDTFTDIMSNLNTKLTEGYTPNMSGFHITEIVENIAVYIGTFIPMVVLLVCAGLVIVVAYARALELLVLTAMSPIACSTFASKETNHIGKNFIINYFSVVMQGVVIAVGFKLYELMLQDNSDKLLEGMKMTTSATDVVKDLFAVCFCSVIFAIFIGKSKNMAAQALGK